MTTTHRSHDMTDKLREIARHVANGPHHPSCPKASIQTSEYRCTCVKGRACAALAAAPQPVPDEFEDCTGYPVEDGLGENDPAPVGREALVQMIVQAMLGRVVGLHMAETIADALLARGLRLPGGDETMAWAVVGEEGKMVGINYDRMTAQHLCNPGERIVRVAIREVEGGGDDA